MFHYIGHGTRLADGYSALVLTAADGSASPTRSDELAAVLAEAPGLRLAVLNACHGAAGDGRDPFASAAASLVKAGLPAVIAMARTISDSAAIVFAEELYGALARGRGSMRPSVRDAVRCSASSDGTGRPSPCTSARRSTPR